MKKIVLCVIVLMIAGQMLAAQNAAQNAEAIVRSSRDRNKSETFSTRSRMTIRAKDGTT